MSGILYTATLVTALGCGLVAGVFFAFSSFVMAALRRLKPEEGIAAMQAFNIPLNNRLAGLHPQGAEAAGYWAKYVTTWTAWNHVRTIAALAAAALLTVALCV